MSKITREAIIKHIRENHTEKKLSDQDMLDIADIIISDDIPRNGIKDMEGVQDYLRQADFRKWERVQKNNLL